MASRREKRFRRWMVVLGAFFLLLGALMPFHSGWLLDLIDRMGRFFRFPSHLITINGSFWKSIVSSYWVTLAYCFLHAGFRPKKSQAHVTIILISLFFSSLMSLILYKSETAEFGYLLLFGAGLMAAFIVTGLYASMVLEPKDGTGVDYATLKEKL